MARKTHEPIKRAYKTYRARMTRVRTMLVERDALKAERYEKVKCATLPIDKEMTDLYDAQRGSTEAGNWRCCQNPTAVQQITMCERNLAYKEQDKIRRKRDQVVASFRGLDKRITRLTVKADELANTAKIAYASAAIEKYGPRCSVMFNTGQIFSNVDYPRRTKVTLQIDWDPISRDQPFGRHYGHEGIKGFDWSKALGLGDGEVEVTTVRNVKR